MEVLCENVETTLTHQSRKMCIKIGYLHKARQLPDSFEMHLLNINNVFL